MQIGTVSYSHTRFSRSNVNPDCLPFLIRLHILIFEIGTCETEGFLKSLRGEFLNTKAFCTGFVLRHVVITIFSVNRSPHQPLLCFLGRWFRIWPTKYRFRKKKLSARAIWKIWGKKQKFENNIKRRHTIRKMMREFRIWPQNSNPKTFGPLFAKNIVDNWLNPRFSQWSTIFFVNRRVKFYPNKILKPNLE